MRKLLNFKKSIKGAKSLVQEKPFAIVFDNDKTPDGFQPIRIKFV